MSESDKTIRLFWFEVSQFSANIILLISLAGLVITPLEGYSYLRWIVLDFSTERFVEYWDYYIPLILVFLGHVILTAVFAYICIMIGGRFNFEQDDHSAPVLFVIALAGLLTFSIFTFIDIHAISTTIDYWDDPWYFFFDRVEQLTYQIFFFVGRVLVTLLWVKVIIGTVGFMRR